MKRTTLGLVCSMLILVLSACVLPSGDVVSARDVLGQTALSAGTDPETIHLLEGARTHGPEALQDQSAQVELTDNVEDGITHLKRAYSRLEQGDLAGAVSDFEDGLALFPWDYESFAQLRSLRHAQAAQDRALGGDFHTLLAQLNSAVDADPTDAQILYKRGTLYLIHADLNGSRSDLNAAAADFDAAIEADPNFAPAYHRRAVLKARDVIDADNFVSDATGGIPLESLIAVIENGVGTLDLNTGHAQLTIRKGTVTIRDRATGEVSVKAFDDWTAELNSVTEQADILAAAAFSDFAQALALDPDSSEAVHDMAVFNFSQWRPAVFDLVIGQLDDDDRAKLDAAVDGLNHAVALSAPNRQIRLNRALASLFQGLFVGRESEAQGDEAYLQAVTALEAALADADSIIAEAAQSGWAYYVRVLAQSLLNELGALEIDSNMENQIEHDQQRFSELVPDVNWDFHMVQAAGQVRFATPTVVETASPPFLTSGRLEVGDGEAFYVNPAYGIRLALPAQGPNGSIQAVALDGGPLLVHIADDYRVFDLLALQADLTQQSLEEWLQKRYLQIHADAFVAEEALLTQYGPALLVTLGEDDGRMLAFLHVGNEVFSFDYSLGVYGDTSFDTKVYGFDRKPMETILVEFILGLEIDGVEASESRPND